MKQKFKWLLALVAMVASVNLMADSAKIIFSNGTNSGSNYYFQSNSGTITNVLTFSSAKNGSSNDPAYNSNSSELRMYYSSKGNGGSITITANGGVTFSGFVLTADKTPTTKYTADAGTATQVTYSNRVATVTGLSCSSITIQNCNTTNTQLTIKSIEITYSGGTTKTLSSIAISGTPKTTYEAGEEFDYSGLVVTGTYTEGDPEVITSGIAWNVTPAGALTAGTPSVSVTATVSGKSDTKNYDVLVTKPVGDKLTLSSTGVSGSSYTEWSGKTGSEGVAVYAGKSAGSNSSIQLNKTNPNGIVSTTSAGLIKKVKVDWESHTSDSRYITIYGSNTAYTGSADVYDTEKQGTSLGTIKKGTNTELTITGDYAYVGVRANDALYMSSITFVWEAAKEITKVEVTKSPTKMEYNAKENFDPSGMKITLTYDDNSTKDVEYDSKDNKWSFEPALTDPLKVGDDIIVTYDGVEAEDFVGITVNPLTTIITAGDRNVEENSEIKDLNAWCSVTEGYDGILSFESSNEKALAVIESGALAGDAGEETTLTITAPATNYYAQASKAITVTVVSAIPEYDVVWSAQTGSITGGSTKVLDGSKVETLPTFDETTVCEGNSFMGWTNEVISIPTNTPPSVLFKTAANAPEVHEGDVIDNTVTYYAVYAKNLVQDYKKVTSIATGDEVIIALEDNDGKPATGVTGANSNEKDATVSSNEAEWLVFAIEEGGYFKNGNNYIKALDKKFQLSTSEKSPLIVDETSCLFASISSSKDHKLMTNTDANGTYNRFYASTNSYTNFYVYSVKKNVISGYSTTCTAPVAIDAPTILPEEREIAAATQEITITQTQTGVGEISIYYTLDGTEPTTESTKYTGGFVIGEGTTVVKAIAADNAGNQSSVVTATFKLDKGYVSTIAEFLAKEEGWTGEIHFTTENFAVITARSADDKTIYMQDETGAICVYYGSGLVKAAAINSKVVGTVSGKRANNAGVPELIPGSGQFPAASITTGGTRPTPVEIEAVNEAAWNANPCKLVTLKNVYYSSTSTGHYTFTNEGGTVSNDIYDSFGILSGKTMPETTAKCNITGIMIRYSATYELAPALIEEITTDQTAALPSLTLNGEAETTPSTDEQNPKKVDYLSPVVVTPAAKTSLVINGEALTESSKTFNVSTATTIAITAKRDFYADNSVTYYYAPAQTPYNITIKENVHGSAVAKVDGVVVTTALSTNTVTIVVTPNNHWTLNKSNWSIKNASEENVLYTEVSTNNFTFTMPESDISVTLSFTQDPKYSVTFDKNGDAEGDDPTMEDQYVDAEVNLPANPYTWENHSFQGWIVTDAATGEIVVPQSEGKFTMPAYNVKATAQWKEIQSCKISFIVAGVEQSYVNQPQEVTYTITETADAPDGFEFLGWSKEDVETETQIPATLVTEYTPTLDETEVSLYAIFSYTKQTATYGKFVKVTSEPTDWSGEYLISNNVNNTSVMVLKGDQTTTFTASYETTESADGVIDGTDEMKGYKVTLSGNSTDGYTIKYNSGYYLSYNSGSNGISADQNTSKAIAYTVSYDNTNSKVVIQCPVSNGAKFQYYTSDKIFKFYKSNQAPIQLYKLDKGTIYYTSYPVAKVSITFNANGGDKACDNEMINKGTVLTICDDIPAQRGKEFKYWEDAAQNTYVPGETYTFNEDATLTAQWNDLPVRHITYNINGGTGTTPVDANDYYENDQITLASAEGIEKEGFVFNNWKVTYNGTEEVTVTAGKFLMPDADVTATAQWRDERVSYWHLVTTMSMLKAGDQVIVAAAGDYEHAMGVESSNIRGVVDIEKVTDADHFDDEKIKFTTSPVVFTLEAGAVDGTFAFYDGENYLASSSSNNKISHSATKTNEASWMITIDAEGKTQVVAQGTNTYKYLQYNADRFSGYSSASCKPVALYKYIEGNKAVREVSADTYTTFCIPQGVEVGNFYGATFWNIADKTFMAGDQRLYSITIEQEEGNLGAGVPYIMLADAETTEFVYYATGEEEVAGTNNGLVGVFETTMFGSVANDEEAIERGIYIISNGTLYLCGNNCGVYENRAYILRDQINPLPQSGAPRRVIGNPNGTPTTLNGIFGNQSIKAQKALIDGNIYIFRNNKMYNAQGQFVK